MQSWPHCDSIILCKFPYFSTAIIYNETMTSCLVLRCRSYSFDLDYNLKLKKKKNYLAYYE